MLVTCHFHRFWIDFTGNSTHLLHLISSLHIWHLLTCWRKRCPMAHAAASKAGPTSPAGSTSERSYRHERQGHGGKTKKRLFGFPSFVLIYSMSCCEAESFWKLAEYQCRVQIYVRVYVDACIHVFNRIVERNLKKIPHFHCFWPNFASKTSVNLAQPEDSSKVNARCLNVSLDNILKL